MDADIQITVGTVWTDWFSCQICNSITLNFLTSFLFSFIPKFHTIVCVHSAAFKPLGQRGVACLGAGTVADGLS